MRRIFRVEEFMEQVFDRERLGEDRRHAEIEEPLLLMPPKESCQHDHRWRARRSQALFDPRPLEVV